MSSSPSREHLFSSCKLASKHISFVKSIPQVPELNAVLVWSSIVNMRLSSKALLFLMSLFFSPLPLSLTLPISAAHLANATSSNNTIASIHQFMSRSVDATSGTSTANVTPKASGVVAHKPEILEVASKTFSEANFSSSSTNATKKLPAATVKIMPMTSAVAAEELKSLHPITISALKHSPTETTVDAADESTSCPNTPYQKQEQCTTSTGSQWSFGLDDSIGITFGLAQTVLAVWPAMVAWRFLHEHPAAAHA
jgi:hypothetical protein